MLLPASLLTGALWQTRRPRGRAAHGRRLAALAALALWSLWCANPREIDPGLRRRRRRGTWRRSGSAGSVVGAGATVAGGAAGERRAGRRVGGGARWHGLDARRGAGEASGRRAGRGRERLLRDEHVARSERRRRHGRVIGRVLARHVGDDLPGARALALGLPERRRAPRRAGPSPSLPRSPGTAPRPEVEHLAVCALARADGDGHGAAARTAPGRRRPTTGRQPEARRRPVCGSTVASDDAAGTGQAAGAGRGRVDARHEARPHRRGQAAARGLGHDRPLLVEADPDRGHDSGV